MLSHQPPFRLREIKLEVTHRCLLACIHCSSDAHEATSSEMSRENCIRIIRDAIAMGVRKFAFSGGEPLLWEHLEEIVRDTAGSASDISIYTSGNVPDVDARLGGLARLGVSTIIFSVFGATEVEHERITRVKGSFSGTSNAINAARKYRLNTELHFVPLSNSYDFLTGIAHLGRVWGISRISVLRFVPQGRGWLIKNRALDRWQNGELKRSIVMLRRKGFDIRTGSPYNILMLNDQPACSSGIDRLIVGPDLRIYPCDAFKNIKAEELVGTVDYSILGNRGLTECWDHSPFLNAIRGYLTSDFCEPCLSCDGLEKCLSGCLAQKVIVNGTLRKSADPLCMML